MKTIIFFLMAASLSILVLLLAGVGLGLLDQEAMSVFLEAVADTFRSFAMISSGLAETH